MFFAVLAQVLGMLLDLLTVRWRSAATKDLEILVLRQEPARAAAHAGSCPSAVALGETDAGGAHEQA